MSGPVATGIYPPNFRLTRLVGIFNVNFAVLLILGGICMGGYTITIPVWTRLMTQIQSQATKQLETSRKQSIKAALEAEEQAKTEKEKFEAAVRRAEIENRPPASLPAGMDLTKLGMDSPTFMAWTWTEVFSGIVVNLMMLASGIGLLSWRPWARKLGIWTAFLKIVRLVLAYGFFVLVIVPVFAHNLGQMVVEMMASQPGMMGGRGAAPPAEMFERIYAIMYSGMGVGYVVLAVIYPILLIWLLTRPGVKSACSGLLKLPKEPNQPW